MRNLIILILFSIPFLVNADDSQNFSDVITEIAKQVRDSNKSNRLVRLAVTTFVSTGDSGKNKFGVYFTESITSALAKHNKKYKIFERKRLDVIAQENALSLSGFIDEQQALKLGELAPIDFIFSGTYTKLKNTIEINGRLIDVVTGEILTSYSGSIKVTPDLNALFESSIVIKPEVDPCKQKQQEIEYLLNDLSTPEKVEYLAEKAIKIPFDTTCGKIHYDIMFDFRKYKIINETYKAFLLKSLENIDFPANDDRAIAIIKFLASDDYIDDVEWKHGLDVLKRIGDYTLSFYLDILISRKDISKDMETAFNRIDQFMSLVNQKKVGLPIPIDSKAAFFELLDAFNHFYSEENTLLMYCYEKYKDDVVLDENSANKIFTMLESIYLRDPKKNNKKKILNWIIEFINENQMKKKIASELFSFAGNFETTINKENQSEKIDKAPPEHLQILIKGIGDAFCNALALTEHGGQQHDHIDFCIENDIHCPGYIPTLDECIQDIKSDDYYKKVRAFEILEKMGESAQPAETVVRIVLDTDDLLHETETGIIQNHAANILGNIKTNNPKSLKSLVNALGSLNYMVPDAAQTALVKIGKPAVPYLIEALNSKFGGVQYKTVVTLGKIGKDAKQAIEPLEEMYKSTNNPAVYRAIEIALKTIR